MKITSRSAQDTRRLGQELGSMARPGDVLLLIGPLGAGKTCLTQGIAWGLGIEGYATSPSFVVINRYVGRLTLYHIDLYRIESVDEVLDLGLDDYLYADGVCAIEWADRALPALPDENLTIEIEPLSGSGRRLALTAAGRRYQEMLSGLDAVAGTGRGRRGR